MRFYSIVFSPTGGTRKAAEALEQGLGENWSQVDLTLAGQDLSGLALTREDLCLVAVPSYGGRVPETAAARLEGLRGNGAAAVLLAVYGNRAYEDTLVELRDLLTRNGFRCVAGVSAVAEHSIAREFAAGRPDGEDREELTAFGRQIREKLAGEDPFREPVLPGNRPYKEYGRSGAKPQGGEDCIRCGICAPRCPVGAIPVADPASTDPQVCISCMRCVAICPQKARKVAPEVLEALSGRLAKVCGDRKGNQLFL